MRVSYGYANILLAALALAASSGKGVFASRLSFPRDRNTGKADRIRMQSFVKGLGMGGNVIKGDDVYQDGVVGVLGIDGLHLVTVTGGNAGVVGEVNRGEDGSGGGGGGEYGSEEVDEALGVGRVVISKDGIDGGGKDGLTNAVEIGGGNIQSGEMEGMVGLAGADNLHEQEKASQLKLKSVLALKKSIDKDTYDTAAEENKDMNTERLHDSHLVKPKDKEAREVRALHLVKLQSTGGEQAGKDQYFKGLLHATITSTDESKKRSTVTVDICAVTDTDMLDKDKKIGYFHNIAVQAKANAVIQVKALWLRDGSTDIVILFFLTIALCLITAKANTKKNADKKKAKFTRVSCGYYQQHRNYIYQIALYFLIVVRTATSDSYVWHCGVELNYQTACEVSYDGTATQSCVCEGFPSGGVFFVCQYECSRHNHKVEGICVSCAAGYFYGYIPSGETVTTECPNTDGNTCACYITTTTPATSSAPASSTDWPFYFVCNNNANDDATPRNMQSYDDDDSNICNPCPPGTFNKYQGAMCEPCEVGSYNNQWGAESCTVCPAGHISTSAGSTACSACPAGTYYTGSTECKECQAGYYSLSGSTECTDCVGGTFQNQSGQPGCIDAQIGWYVGTTNAFSPHTQEYPCPIGSYSDTAGAPSCTSCPAGMSTYAIGSTSPDNCVKCQYGVDANTFACLDAENNPFDNICWNASQLLSLNASSSVDDLDNLVYSPKDVGINDLVNGAMSVIQGAADGTSSIQDIQRVLDNLKNATENWLDNLQSNFSSCVDATKQDVYNIAQTELFANTNLFQYQFNDVGAETRYEWIAQWKCSGATFGCSIENSNCPQAQTCFDPLYKYFGSILSFPGGTPFGNYDELNTGRYTPMYSPDFIANQLEDNVKSLVQWENTVQSFVRYANVLNEIQASAASEEAFTAGAIDVLLQVQDVSTSVSTESSYTEGSLYYKQALYNYNETFYNAQIVQWGPAYCPSGYDITPDGIPPSCSDYNTLVQECQKEIKWDEAIKLIVDTMKLCATLVAPVDAGAFMKGLKGVSKAFNSVGALATTALTFSQETFARGVLWNPNTQLPPVPNSTSNGAFGNPEYANASYNWYLSGQQNLSQSLITMSSAFWQSIYLENEKQIGPTIQNPPNCPSYKSKIVSALNGYLANVKNMSNYGDAMTSAEMDLVPAMGSIAAGIATQEAIVTANEEISAMVTPSNQLIQTAPSSYQEVYTTLFSSAYPDKTKTLLAYGPSASCAQNQYVAAKSIFGFCTSYSYMNAGQEYVSTYDGNTANCNDFGNLYLPTYTTFQDTVSSFVSGSTSTTFEIPSSVYQLNKYMVGFAANVQGNPAAVGGASGYGEVGWDNPEEFSLFFPLNGTNDNATSSINYYEDLETGTIRFTLFPSSDLLLQSTIPFSINDANPRVINVQMYLKGVTSPFGEFVTMTINPTSPYMLYPDDSGVGTAYTLPPYNSSNDNVFAKFNSIQGTCAGTDQTTLTTKWMNGEDLLFCTDYSSDFQEPYEGIQSSAFAFPSLFATWTWQLNTDIRNQEYYTVVMDELQLQIVFQYVPSLLPSEGSPNDCALGCDVNFNPDANSSPLLGRQWCDRSECGDCAASLPSINSEPFCLCNVWTGFHETCTPSAVTSGTFTIKAVSSGSGARKLISRNTNKNMRGAKGAKDGAKADKSKMMPEAESLQEMLGLYLVQCDIYSNGFLQSDTVVMEDCKKKKIKSSFSCDFHVTFSSYEGNESDIQEEAHECMMATLANEDVMQDIMDVTGLCAVSIKFNRKMVFDEDACDIFE